MTTFINNIKIDQGATYNETVTWKSGKPSVPVDLTGCTAKMQVRLKLDTPTTLLELTTENGGIVLGGIMGTITRYISDENTSLITWKTGVYDLKIMYPDGTTVRKISGTVTVSMGVTRV